jgi:hypothetical protein
VDAARAFTRRSFSIGGDWVGIDKPCLKSHSEERSDERILLASGKRSFRYAQDDMKKVLLRQRLSFFKGGDRFG